MNGDTKRYAIAVEVGIEGDCSRTALPSEVVTETGDEFIPQRMLEAKASALRVGVISPIVLRQRAVLSGLEIPSGVPSGANGKLPPKSYIKGRVNNKAHNASAVVHNAIGREKP
jgi:hypothetical protein